MRSRLATRLATRAVLLVSSGTPVLAFSIRQLARRPFAVTTSPSIRYMMSDSSTSPPPPPPPPLTHIGKQQMEDILESLEQEGKESGFVVIDVRGEDEVAATGKLSPSVHTLPLPVIMQLKVFEMEADEFEVTCRFPKPDPDETLVFTCAAGVRSQHAAFFASQGGYGKLINYMGGSYEWFS